MEEHTHPEIIFIKRRGGHEEEHHGGAWKIAFADFMTAMMAFFLVLWIISATDKNTKTIIARYFNPVKLEESSRTPKSIHGDGSSNPALTSPGVKPNLDTNVPGDANTEVPPDGKNDPVTTANGLDKPDPRRSGSAANMGDPASPKATMSEGVLFADPYKSLDLIAGPSSPNTLAVMQRDKADGAIPEGAGLADPFRVAASRPKSEAKSPVAEAPPPSPHASPRASPAQMQIHQAPPPAAAPTLATTPTPASTLASADVKLSTAPLTPKPTAAAAARLQKELELQLGALGAKKLGPAIDVKATNEGLLITLTDKLNYSMFAIGSAEPQPQVIQAMDAVARLLKGRRGLVVVRGYTDGHPYRSKTYDNWRLSSARAQMAYYMLTRAGLPENRFDRIEGYGDKHLREPSHPFAAENRRIEVLLEEGKP